MKSNKQLTAIFQKSNSVIIKVNTESYAIDNLSDFDSAFYLSDNGNMSIVWVITYQKANN